MTEIEQLKNEVRRCVRRYGYIRVAAVAGLGSKNTLRGIESDGWNPTSETLERVIAAIRGPSFNAEPNKGKAA